MKSVATVDQLVTNLQRVFQPFQYKNPSSKAALGQLIPSFSSSKFSTNLTTCSYSLVKYIHLQYTTEFLSTLKTNTRLPHGTDIGRHHLALPSGLNDLLPSVETCSLSKVASHPGAACMPDQTPIAGQSLHPVPTQESSENTATSSALPVRPEVATLTAPTPPSAPHSPFSTISLWICFLSRGSSRRIGTFPC